MSVQFFRLVKPLAALGTLERLETNVVAVFVSGEVARIGETLVADKALVWLLTRVGLHVQNQILLQCKRFVACFTAKCLFSVDTSFLHALIGKAQKWLLPVSSHPFGRQFLIAPKS